MKFSEFLTEAKIKMLGTREEIEAWLDKMRIRKFTINDDLSIDVNGNALLNDVDINFLPVTFNSVNGDFTITNCNLKSLKGVPRIVKGHFKADHNHLQSLSYGPVTVYGTYMCHNNKLQDLRSPLKSVGKDFHCNNNPLKTLKGGPTTVEGDFHCGNTDIKNFEGGPVMVNGNFYTPDCPNLVSVDGLPEVVGKELVITSNPNLKSLHNISKNLKSCKSITVPSLITKDILGLLKIDCKLDGSYLPMNSDILKAFEILIKFRNREDTANAIFDCQEALIDAGLEDYANI